MIEGPDVPELSFRLMRKMQKDRAPEGKVGWFSGMLSKEEFMATMLEEQRLIYEFHVRRAYGYY